MKEILLVDDGNVVIAGRMDDEGEVTSFVVRSPNKSYTLTPDSLDVDARERPRAPKAPTYFRMVEPDEELLRGLVESLTTRADRQAIRDIAFAVQALNRGESGIFVHLVGPTIDRLDLERRDRP